MVPLALWEARQAVRSRWVLTTGAVFVAACLIVTLFGLRSLRALGLAGASALSDALIAVGILLPPLLGLLLGSTSLAGPREGGLLALLSSQPTGRERLALGAFLGASMTLTAVVLAGHGSVLIVLSGVTSGSDLPALAGVTFGTLAAGTTAVAIGVAVSAVSRTRLQAVAGAVSVWFVLALGADILLAGLVPGLGLGPSGMLMAVMANPLESARVLALLVAAPGGTALGPFGEFLALQHGLGESISLLGAGLGLWIVIPVVFAGRVLRRAEL